MDLVRTNKKTDRIEDLVDKCEKNTRISSTINHSTSLPESAFQPPVAVPINTVYSGLVLSVRTLQNKAIISGEDFRSAITQPAPMSAPIQKFDWPDCVTKCSYCWAQDHYLKRHCSAFQEDLNTTRIHLGDDRKVCVGWC